MTPTEKDGTPGSGGGCGCAPRTVPLQSLRPRTLGRIDTPWSDGVVTTEVGSVPRVRASLIPRDRLGTFRVRSGIGRDNYRVAPGLYAVGNPTPASPMLVTANYKLSFDRLRSVLPGRDAWILVLDTHGINVWCAEGKGTFGTNELVRRVKAAALDRIVSHRTLIVPQLGATGVSAHLVRRLCGFRVVYGPVRAEDLPAFLDAGMQALPEMRRVRFGLRDRVVLVPFEVLSGGRYALLAAAALLLLGGLNPHGYALAGVGTAGLVAAISVLCTFLSAAILGPMLLPLLPGRAFSVKGAALGVAGVAGVAGILAVRGSSPAGLHNVWMHGAAWALIVPAISSFVVMTFTGCTTFTSLSGVKREMRFAVPAQVAAAAIGLCLWVIGLFLIGGRTS